MRARVSICNEAGGVYRQMWGGQYGQLCRVIV